MTVCRHRNFGVAFLRPYLDASGGGESDCLLVNVIINMIAQIEYIWKRKFSVSESNLLYLETLQFG